MKKKLQIPLLLLLGLAVIVAVVAAVQKGQQLPDNSDGDHDSTSSAAAAQRIADALVQTYGANSVQYALIDEGSIVLSGSSGGFSRTDNRPVTPHDMYGIGSTSKMFTAAAAMQLYERGLIDLEAPLTTYIPEFRMLDARYAEITPRMLLNHSSGICGRP